MSTNILSIIPTDPFWVPGAEAAEVARAILARVYPGAREVALDWHEDPVFVDQGENFENVRCPGCHSDLPVDWWQDQMDEATEARSAKTPKGEASGLGTCVTASADA